MTPELKMSTADPTKIDPTCTTTAIDPTTFKDASEYHTALYLANCLVDIASSKTGYSFFFTSIAQNKAATMTIQQEMCPLWWGVTPATALPATPTADQIAA
jgi:hypothetical protein